MDAPPLLQTTLPPTGVLPSGAVPVFRLVAGDISQIKTGNVLPATVVKADRGEAVLTLGGQRVTVRGTAPIVPGDVLRVRVEAGTHPTLTVIGREPPRPNSSPAPTVRGDQPQNLPGTNRRPDAGSELKPPASPPTPDPSKPAQTRSSTVQRSAVPTDSPAPARPQTQPATRTAIPPEPKVVDVIAREPNGRVRVQIDGEETIAAAPRPLQPGGRYVVQVDRTPAGVVLRPLPDTPQVATTIATAFLRAEKPPPLGDTLPTLARELASPPADPKVQAAAAEVREVAVKLLPPPDRPPTADAIRQVVEDGGTHFEAKLARAADPNEPHRPPPPAPGTDLKGGLLALARSVPNLVVAFPAAAATLDGIERQQATNVFTQQNGGMAVYQIPFPDGPHWRTLGLGIEPDWQAARDAAGRAGGFRVMMHVPLTTLGETWIDATAEPNRLRAILYLSDPAARDQVREELPALRTELQSGGFADVLLDVRPAADLTEAQRRKANAVKEGVPDRGGLVDVRA